MGYSDRVIELDKNLLIIMGLDSEYYTKVFTLTSGNGTRSWNVLHG